MSGMNINFDLKQNPILIKSLFEFCLYTTMCKIRT